MCSAATLPPIVWGSVFVLFLIGITNPVTGKKSPEGKLLDKLLKDYNSNVRPVYDVEKPINVSVGLSLIRINDLDVARETLDISVWLDLEWVDPMLRWDPGNFSGMHSVGLPADLTWSPDLTIVNLATPLSLLTPKRKMISSDGTVFWSSGYRTRTHCALDESSSNHTCSIRLLSWSYDGFRVDVKNRTESVDLTNYQLNKHWKLIGSRVERNVVYYSCCVEPFPDVNFKITLAARK